MHKYFIYFPVEFIYLQFYSSCLCHYKTTNSISYIPHSHTHDSIFKVGGIHPHAHIPSTHPHLLPTYVCSRQFIVPQLQLQL